MIHFDMQRKNLFSLKAVSHGNTYAQQNIIANLFTQHVSEVEQNTQRVGTSDLLGYHSVKLSVKPEQFLYHH